MPAWIVGWDAGTLITTPASAGGTAITHNPATRNRTAAVARVRIRQVSAPAPYR